MFHKLTILQFRRCAKNGDTDQERKGTYVGTNCRWLRMETSLKTHIWKFENGFSYKMALSQKLLVLSSSRILPKRLNSTLNFDDFQNVYKFRSTPQLLRSYAILRLCGINIFVDNSLNVSFKKMRENSKYTHGRKGQYDNEAIF